MSVKALDVAMSSGSVSPPRPARASSTRWDGLETPWVHAAMAAAPWPLWCAIASVGIPGSNAPFTRASGVLALASVLALMVWWSFRPDARALLRWIPSVIGTGLIGELLVGVIAESRVGSPASDLARAIAIWLAMIAIYEVAPIVAAASRLTSREHRMGVLDLVAHVLFLAIAACAYAWTPRGEPLVSPWIAVALALPLAAARCGPRRAAHLPAPVMREGAIWILAIGAWILTTSIALADLDHLVRAARSVERGVDPAHGVILVLPAWSIALSIAAAIVLLSRARHAKNAPYGTVVAVGQDGITIERGSEDPLNVALESGAVPSAGASVTLLGVRERASDVGPFRDGAPRLVATRAYAGTPEDLARSLSHRAGGWLAWAAAGAIGLWLHVLLLD